MAGMVTLARAAFPGEEWQAPPAGADVAHPAQVDKAMASLEAVMGREGNAGTVVVQDGYVLWEGVDTKRKRAVWSCTKSFLSTCLGLLWDDGKCSPDDLASKHLPGLAAKYPGVTLRHLATFTSGVNLPLLTLEPGLPNFAPGEAMHYSSESDLLALILTKVAGEPLRELFKRRIADPIGMDPEGWEWKSVHERDGIAVNGGAGMRENGMHISARNLARFGWLYASGGNWNGRQLISRRYIDEATRPQVASSVPMFDPKDWYKQLPGTYGMNWWTNGVTTEGRRIWPSAPAEAFAALGNMNNICIIIPKWKLVLARAADDEVRDISLFDGPLKILGGASARP